MSEEGDERKSKSRRRKKCVEKKRARACAGFVFCLPLHAFCLGCYLGYQICFLGTPFEPRAHNKTKRETEREGRKRKAARRALSSKRRTNDDGVSTRDDVFVFLSRVPLFFFFFVVVFFGVVENEWEWQSSSSSSLSRFLPSFAALAIVVVVVVVVVLFREKRETERDWKSAER